MSPRLLGWLIALAISSPSFALPAERDARFTLENGLRVWISQAGPGEDLTEVRLLVAAGTDEEGEGQAGAAWVTARALAEPADALDLRRALPRLGTELALEVERGHVQLALTGPGDRCLQILQALSALLARPEVTVAAWSAAETSWLRGLALEADRPTARAERSLARLAWGETAVEAKSGLPDDRRLARLVEFHGRHYGGSRMALALRSPLPVDVVSAAVRRAFSGLPRGSAAPRERGEPQPLPAVTAPACIRQEGLYPPLLLIGRGVRLDDDASFFGWQALAHILGGSHSSRLLRRLRLDEPLVYNVDTDWFAVGARDARRLRGFPGLTLRISCQTDEVERARMVILEELAKLAQQEVAPQEIATARAILRSRLLLERGSAAAELGRWARRQVDEAPGLDLAAALPLVEGLTPERLLALARSEPGAAATVVVGGELPAFCSLPRAAEEPPATGGAR